MYLPSDLAVLEADPLLSSLDPGERRAMVAAREADGSLRFNVHLQGTARNPVPDLPGAPAMTGRVTICESVLDAVAGIPDGATILVGGFGAAGQPVALIEALLEGGARELTVVSNNAGGGNHGLAALIRDGRVRKVVCSYPRQADSWHFDAAYRQAGLSSSSCRRAKNHDTARGG